MRPLNIYIITNKVNNKQYVGLTTKTIQERFWAHKYAASKNRGYYLHNAIRKYGENNFIVEHLDTAENLIELKKKEIFYIHKYNTYEHGYNLTKGGDFSSNSGYLIAEDKDSNIMRVTCSEFNERDDLISVNKNKITIFKDSENKRVSSEEYKNKWFEQGWRSKNYGYTTVKLKDGVITKIKSEDFDKSIHMGVSSGSQIYYNSETKSFERVSLGDIDLTKHYNKQKCKYYVYDNNNIVDITLSKIPSEEFGGLQFRYLVNRNSDCSEWILSEEILLKLKPKNRNFDFLDWKLIKEQL